MSVTVVAGTRVTLGVELQAVKQRAVSKRMHEEKRFVTFVRFVVIIPPPYG
jgi:hypothetical protein